MPPQWRRPRAIRRGSRWVRSRSLQAIFHRLRAAPPLMSAPMHGGDERAAALSKVSAPAICLMVAGGLTAAFSIFNIILVLMGFNNLNRPTFPQRQAPGIIIEKNTTAYGRGYRTGYRAGTIAGMVMGPLISAVMIFGGVKMKKLENRGMCIAASIIAMLPCSLCCVFNLPIGIWALIVLNDSVVKRHFG